MTALLEAPAAPEAEQAAPGTYPLPPGRGRWRLTLHRRVFVGGGTYEAALLAELTNATGRRLEQKWNAPSSLTFTLNGRDPEAALINELQHDVIAWRWDDTAGVDRPMFRGVIGQAEDQLTEQKHVVTFTCHDYAAMLNRRFLTATYAPAATDQDTIVATLLNRAVNAAASGGFAFLPGSFMPLAAQNVAPDGTARGLSGTNRDRAYYGQQNIGTAISDLAAVIGGFDFDVLPMGMPDHETDALRVFFPNQGITRTSPVLEYGGGVATVTRALSSDSYANYVRVLGNNTTSSDPAAPQVYAEAYNPDASGVVVGFWPLADTAADVSVGTTLGQQANGDLAYYGVLMPSYTLTLVPDFYYAGMFNMGDTLPLVIMSGRLAVNAPVRVVGLTFDVGDDGDETVGVTLGRPVQRLTDLLGKYAADVAALARR